MRGVHDHVNGKPLVGKGGEVCMRCQYVTCGAVFAAGGAFASSLLSGTSWVTWLWVAVGVVCVVVVLLGGDHR